MTNFQYSELYHYWCHRDYSYWSGYTGWHYNNYKRVSKKNGSLISTLPDEKSLMAQSVSHKLCTAHEAAQEIVMPNLVDSSSSTIVCSWKIEHIITGVTKIIKIYLEMVKMLLWLILTNIYIVQNIWRQSDNWRFQNFHEIVNSSLALSTDQ